MATAGIDIGGTKMLMLAECEGKRISKTVPTGARCTPEKIREAIDAFVGELPDSVGRLGIAIPGLVENADTVVVSDVLPLIAGMDAGFLKSGHSVHLLNDVKAALLHETAGDERTDTAVIMAGTGIAMGMKQNGQVITGCRGWAGELGSMPIPTSQGVRTLDELAGGAGILNSADMDAGTLLQQLKEGDEAAKAVVRSAGEYFGLALSTVIHLLNPEKIILGGGTIRYDGYLQAAVRTAQANTLPELWEACTIRKAQEAQHMVALGAMRFAEQQDE
ncbi:ROK family protein [Bhargavaea ullalensis]|uniref:NBD/HSP70 family sugar kinase n=1 Tax=Bhargavaea ullalensis TaxID=1265685 RepID=A0ABV2G859_9BACL